jgi:alpha-tubulin suppressor-like RCC1 family protein
VYAEPVRVQGAPPLARVIATSGMLSCTLDSAGAAWCLGDNANGKAGTITEIGSVERPARPVGSERLSFVVVTTGGTHTCLVSRQGPSWCVGSNARGQLGIGQDAGSGSMRMGFSAQDSVAGDRFTSLSGGGLHTCGLTSGGLAYCWGYNRYGQLGIGEPDTLPHAAPVPVAGGRSFASLTAGAYHTCGVTSAGEAFCWGRNLHGRLGDSTATDAGAPRPVAGGHRFYGVSAGYNHTCGVTTAGAALCWGDNSSGALGSGTREGSAVPVRVVGP